MAVDPDRRLVWPPTLSDLKRDLSLREDDEDDDESLADQLAAAMAFVARTHEGRYEFGGDAFGLLSPLPQPGPEMVLGTVRLAGRWWTRKRSPDGTIAMGDIGTTTIPGFDSDLERMLEMGRYGGSMIV
jgi:hypothetical protein